MLTATLLALAGLASLIPLQLVSAPAIDHARDLWLYALAWGAAALLLITEPALGLMAIAVLIHWRRHEQLASVLTWAAILALWFVVAAIPPAGMTKLVLAWRGIALVQVGLATWQWHRGQLPSGTMGQRTLVGAFLALCWPFASPWEWPVYAWGLGLTSGWLPVLAVGAGLLVMRPGLAPGVVGFVALVIVLRACFGRRVLDVLPRGGSIKSLRTRWQTWWIVFRLGRRWPIWLIGRGPGLGRGSTDTPALDAVRARVMLGTVTIHPFHCEPLELWYSYGLLGVAAMAALAWRLWPHLHAGDPWTAAAVAGGVLSLASIPCRVIPVGLTWWVILAVLGARA